MRQIICFALILCTAGIIQGQKLDHVLGHLLVRMEAQKSPERLADQFNVFQRTPTRVKVDRMISQHMDTYLFSFDHVRIHEGAFLEALQAHPDVHTAQFNHVIALRQTVPDDPQFVNQWQYLNTGQGGGTPGADINADLAWDLATGGVTIDGDTIVVCVVDDNFSLSHPDIVDNLWINHGEIPGNGIDDDLNGYVDDINGWNIDDDNNDLGGFGGHGNAVAGIVGAKGNNGVGVAGVNWDVKLMLVNLGQLTESNVLSAYAYPLEFRKKYNESNGAEGAFVVATNASWGIDFGKPDEAPLWCAFYDTLGTYGILNCGATANLNINVDESGDLPTACESDYLISVTNMDRNDMKVSSAGYGLESIDLGAFGSGTWTVAGSNAYGAFGGTSGATPHVAGAVALLYATDCPLLMSIKNQSPGEAALLVKESILNGAQPNASLDGITVTGARLNLFGAAEYLLERGSECPAPFAIRVDSILDVQATISWGVTDSVDYSALHWRLAGSDTWTTIDSITSPYVLTGLTACNVYEFAISNLCGEMTAVSDTIAFESEGCCVLPDLVDFDNLTEEMTMVSWEDIFAGVGYALAIRNTNETTYDTVITADNGVILDSLVSCTEYEVRFLTDCDTSDTGFSEPYFFTTAGCGACLDFTYCASKGDNVEDEWIERFTFGPIDNLSGPNDGYAFFADEPALFFPGAEYIIRIEPGFGFVQFEELFSVWIDLNQDGIFQDTAELIYASELTDSTVTDTIVLPYQAEEGSTRMRVSMRFREDAPSVPCDRFEFGEVEDYCIVMGPAQVPCFNVDSLKVDGAVSESSATMIWDKVETSIVFNYRYKKFFDTEWEEPMTTLDTFALLSDLDQCTVYEFQVRTICPADTSQYSQSVTFATDCPTSVEEPGEITGVTLFPNPFSDAVTARIRPDRSGEYAFRMMDIRGNMIREIDRTLSSTVEETIRFEGMDGYPQGIYLLSVTNGNRISTFKVVKL